MPINQDTDLQLRYSIASGSVGNSQPQPFPDQSLGGYCSTTVWPAAAIGDLYSPLLADINKLMLSEHRCFFLCNLHPTLTWKAVKFWIDLKLKHAAALSVGIDLIAPTPIGSTNPQSQVVGVATHAPPGVIFTAPTETGPTLLGDIPPMSVKALWTKRTGRDDTASTDDGAIITFTGTSLP